MSSSTSHASLSTPPVALSIAPPASASPAVQSRLRSLVAIVVCAPLLLAGANIHQKLETKRNPTPAAPLIKKSEDGRSVRWRIPEVQLVVDSSVAVLADGAADVPAAALAAWKLSGADLPNVTLVHAQDSARQARDGVNRIVAKPIGIPGHTEDLAFTIVYSDATTGDILEADIVLNTSYAFQTLPSTPGNDESAASCKGVYDIQSVVTHEMGHFWGLGEDKESVTSTMYFQTAACSVEQRDLKQPDRETIVTLYSGDDDQPGLACSFGDPRSPRSAWAAGFAMVALVLAKRLRAR